jgi:hypothetical protein
MKASNDLIESWQADPAAAVSVIVHVDGPADQYASQVNDHGLTVDRVFRLTDTVAARGSAASVLSILDEPWVSKVELDQEIHTTS